MNLNNVSADNNVTQFGANIYNAGTGASGDVNITGTNSFSGNDDYGLWIVSKSAVNLANITADGNTTSNGTYIDNCIWGGSVLGCQGSGDVTLTGTPVFTNNGNNDDGLYITSAGNVSMANVTATGNGDDGVSIVRPA